MKGLSPLVGSRYSTAREMAVELEKSLGSASQRVVGEWVLGLAGEALEKRVELLQEIEVTKIRSMAPPPMEPNVSQRPGGLEEYAIGVSQRVPAPRRWGKLALLAGTAMVATAGAVALVVVVKSHTAPRSAGALVSPQASEPPSSLKDSPVALVPPSAAAPASSAGSRAGAGSPDAGGLAATPLAPTRTVPPSGRPRPRAPTTGNARTYRPTEL